MKNLYVSKIALIGLLFVFSTPLIYAQISGTVFADYNASGTRTTTNPAEPLMAGVIVTAYNAAGTALASYTTTQGTATSATYPYTAPNFSIPASGTAYNGILGSNTGFVASGTAVRLEFTLSATGCTADNSYYSGQGSSSVQFITAPNTTVSYGINNPADYNTGTTGISIFTPLYISGNPLGSGTSGTANWFVGFPYTNSGTTTPTQKLAGSQIGAVWGLAYSKQAKKIFTSAFLKRHSGYGAMGSGGIYLLTPTASSFTVVQFFDLDNNSFNTASNPITRTRADASAPAYGNGSSFTLSNTNQKVTFNGSTDPVSGFPSGLGVIGTNVQRGLPAASTADSYDGAAFDQVGKVGIGDIDISDDGKYLFVMNLYQRKVFRLELNDAYNPTSVVAVTSYALPTQSCTNGVLRPFATKFYKGKLYVGAVCTGENETTNTNANLSAKVFELNSATYSASFNTSPVLDYPLTYTKGLTSSTSDSSGTRWYPWVNDVSKTRRSTPTSTLLWLPQPMLSDIEFTDKGDMMMSFMDRIGHQVGFNSYYYLGGSSTILAQTEISGDILIAGENCPTGFTLEGNGSFTSNGVAFSSGIANGQGPGGGEFFKFDESIGGGFSPYAHNENNMGAMAVLAGTNSVKTTVMDPLQSTSGGLTTFNTSNATESGLYELYAFTASGTYGKANGLGDLELLTPLAPLEIGNRVWLDTDKDGIQDAGENGIGSVTIELYADFDNNGTPDGAALATTTTSTTTGNALGTWYFNTSNVTDGDPSVGGNQAGPQPNKRYLIRIGSADWTSATGIGTGDLANLLLTTANTGAASQPDFTDNDAALSASIPTISYVTGAEGQNDHTLDFGFMACPTITNPSAAQTICAGTTGSNITVSTDYNAPNGIRFVKFTTDQMAGSTPTATEATNIYAGTVFSTVTPTGVSSPYTATYSFNTADFPNATTSPIIYYVYAILNPDQGASCRPVQEIAITVNPRPAFTLTQTAPTCSGITAQNNGKITLTAVTNADKYGISTGSTYTGVAYASATALGTPPIDVQTAIPNTGGTYTVRLFNGADACSTDQTVTIQAVTCCPNPNCATMTVTKN